MNDEKTLYPDRVARRHRDHRDPGGDAAARARGRCISCSNNLKTYGLAIFTYADTYNEWMIAQENVGPKGESWNNSTTVFSQILAGGSSKIDSYRWLHGLYVNGCDEVPPDETDGGTGSGGNAANHYTWSGNNYWSARGQSYGINCTLMGAGYFSASCGKIGVLKNPSKYVAFADAPTYNFTASTFALETYRRIYPRHLGKRAANLTHLDGHVETNADTKNGYFSNTNTAFVSKLNPAQDGQTRWLMNQK